KEPRLNLNVNRPLLFDLQLKTCQANRARDDEQEYDIFGTIDLQQTREAGPRVEGIFIYHLFGFEFGACAFGDSLGHDSFGFKPIIGLLGSSMKLYSVATEE